jgi:hypothetical protein
MVERVSKKGGIKMTDKLKEAIEVLKKVRHWIDYGAGELEPTANAVIEAIDTVVAHLNTENISELDENLDEKVIGQSDNQEGLSNNKDRKFTPELLQTYLPFAVDLNELLIRKKLGMPTIIKAQSIIARCHLHGMEVGYETAIKFIKNKNHDSRLQKVLSPM